jgi:hypothetical protein
LERRVVETSLGVSVVSMIQKVTYLVQAVDEVEVGVVGPHFGGFAMKVAHSLAQGSMPKRDRPLARTRYEDGCHDLAFSNAQLPATFDLPGGNGKHAFGRLSLC